MKTKISLTLLIFIVLLSGCGLHRGYVLFNEKPDALIATEKVKAFLKQNPNASIVLRVPISTNSATQSDPNSLVYNAIEKELVLSGFNLKDRGLFNQVINSQTSLDYSKIEELTGADLILELVKIDRSVPFTTNIAYTESGEQVILEDGEYTRYGAMIEFKLTLVRNNEYGGSFSFYYTPCTQRNSDCNCSVPYKYGGYKFYPDKVANFCGSDRRSGAVKSYEVMQQDDLVAFVRDGVKKVIKSIK